MCSGARRRSENRCSTTKLWDQLELFQKLNLHWTHLLSCSSTTSEGCCSQPFAHLQTKGRFADNCETVERKVSHNFCFHFVCNSVSCGLFWLKLNRSGSGVLRSTQTKRKSVQHEKAVGPT